MYQKQLLVVHLVNCPTLNSKGSSISSPAEELFYGKRTQMVMWDFGFMFGICMCFVLGVFLLVPLWAGFGSSPPLACP